MERWTSLLGYVVMILLAVAMSSDRKRFPWRIVLVGSTLQFFFAAFIINTQIGQIFFGAVGDFFTALLGFVHEGSKFVFGSGGDPDAYKEHFFAFIILPTIIFMSTLMSILYYLRIMQPIVEVVAWVMQRTMGLSGAESLSAAANIFVGQTEAPLVIRPYLSSMTRSELMAVMIGGFATIAGGVLAAYVGMGLDAGHLMTASVISAPAALMVAKILEPETEVPKTMGTVRIEAVPEGSNVIEAAANGASEGLKLALNVGAMLIAFIALIAMLDGGVTWLGTRFEQKWSLGALLGWCFAPIAWLMGIPYEDCGYGGELLGLKMVANEFLSYMTLHDWMSDGVPDSGRKLHPRTIVIMSYALCGFSNFSSIGIQLGGIGALAPERKGELAQLGLRAMLGGTLACCMTGCVAGVLITEANYKTTKPAQTEAPAEPAPAETPPADLPADPAKAESAEPKKSSTTPAEEDNDEKSATSSTDAEPGVSHSVPIQFESLRHQVVQGEFSPFVWARLIDEQDHQRIGTKFRQHLQASTTRKYAAATRDGHLLELA